MISNHTEQCGTAPCPRDSDISLRFDPRPDLGGCRHTLPYSKCKEIHENHQFFGKLWPLMFSMDNASPENVSGECARHNSTSIDFFPLRSSSKSHLKVYCIQNTRKSMKITDFLQIMISGVVPLRCIDLKSTLTTFYGQCESWKRVWWVCAT